MNKAVVSLLHPFSAQAIGLKEEDLYTSHSKPHEIALSALQKEGYTISIDYFTGKWFPYQKINNTIEKRFWPVTYPWFRKRHFWRKQKSSFHFNITKKTPPDLTIINMSGHGSPYVFAHAAMLKSLQKPYVAMIGGLHMSLTGDALTYYQEAAHIIVHTQIQKKELEKNNEFKKLDIRVMPLGVDIEKFKPNESRKKGVIKLLFVGRISRLKQIELGIEAIAELTKKSNDKLQLIIIGPTSDNEYKKELKKLVKDYKVEENVQFKGEIVHEKLIPYFQEADVLLLPSAHESFGMVMVEAMSCGTPVIALQGAGGPDEIIVHGKSGFLCKKDAYSDTIIRLVNNKVLLSEFSNNAREYVVQKWSLQQTISCFKESIKSVLG